MKLHILELEGDIKKIVLPNDDDIFTGTWLPNILVLDKEEQKKFKEKFGIDLYDTVKNHNDNCLYLNDLNIDKDEWEDFSYDLPYLTGECNSIYCEDIIEKEKIEELEKNDVVFFDKNNDCFYIVQSDIEFDKYLCHWDGSNHKCLKISGYNVIEAEELEKYEVEEALGIEIEEDCNIEHGYAHYDYYKTYYKNTPVYFRVYNSHYQGTLSFLDEEWEVTDDDLLDAVLYDCIPFKVLKEIQKVNTDANALWYEINTKLSNYFYEYERENGKKLEAFSVTFLTDDNHEKLFVDLSALDYDELKSFINIMQKIGYKFDFSVVCKSGVAQILEKGDKNV